MSLSSSAVGELPVSAETASTTISTTSPPPKRKLTAKADVVQQPEAR
jgi:hypothetical protein